MKTLTIILQGISKVVQCPPKLEGIDSKLFILKQLSPERSLPTLGQRKVIKYTAFCQAAEVSSQSSQEIELASWHRLGCFPSQIAQMRFLMFGRQQK